MASVALSITAMLEQKIPLHSVEEMEALATQRPDLLAAEIELFAQIRDRATVNRCALRDYFGNNL
jgi:hypothetical protein